MVLKVNVCLFALSWIVCASRETPKGKADVKAHVFVVGAQGVAGLESSVEVNFLRIIETEKV